MTTFSETDLSAQGSSLTISEQAKYYLKESAKWGRFLAIVGFIFTGFVVLFGLIFSFSFPALQQFPFGGMPGALEVGFSFLLGFIYILIGVLYIFPCLYLYRFSNKIKMALQLNNEEYLTEAFSNHKSLFKFIGIFTAVAVGFYAIIFLFGIMGALIAGSL